MFKKKAAPLAYDKELQKPVIKASICTGEQVAGFKNRQTGKFQDVMLIENDADLKAFMEIYGLSEIQKEY